MSARVREPNAVLAENERLSRLEAPVYDRNHFEIFHPWEQERLRRHLRRYAGAERVLDVGSGTGNVVEKLEAPGRVAVDLSPEMLARIGEKAPPVSLVAGLAEALPLRDAAFDLVVTYSTLHHLADWSALAEMRRVARPGGIVLLDHEEAFQEPGWRGVAYGLMKASLRRIAAAWYWRRPAAWSHLAYRHVSWPHSETELGSVDFFLTDGAHPDPAVIEAELARLGMAFRRRHYLLVPLPMSSRWQQAGDAICARLRLGHFSIEAVR